MPDESIQIKASGLTYRVLIEAGSLHKLGQAMRLLFPAQKALLVSDSNVAKLYLDQCLESLKHEKWQVETILVRPGERSKSAAALTRLYDKAIAAGLDRNCPVIALGGGVVGDLAGFAAATYLRGVPLVMVPTTLLAQVDSSVGGKVAINHPGGKNLIGAFYPPRLVLIDPSTLNTLPRRQLKAGLAEMIKYGVIEDSAFFDYLETNYSSILALNSKALALAVKKSVLAKARVVQSDEFEQDQRRILNFGHTLGHALEAATDYRYYLHGEAVLIGMIAATYLALFSGLIESEEGQRIIGLLKKVGVKPPPPGLTVNNVTDKLRHDKKRCGQDQIFVLPAAIGKVVSLPVNDLEQIKKVTAAYLAGGNTA